MPTQLALVEDQATPVCPWCARPLARIAWHKVRGGPAVGYCIVLSCGTCHGVLESLADTAANGGIVA